MAGDWIKVEHATLEKPEVMLMAELLGVRRDEVIGILCRFWVWLDRNTGNGFVTHVSRSGIDEVMHCPGFAGALESVGWCKFDDPARTITLPHADRHNGNPAKTRALAFDRQRKSRHDSVTQTPLPEKRREEKSNTKSKASTARKRAMPPDFAISERVRQWAADKGHDRLSERLEHFKGKALAKGYVYADWDEGFMGAVRDDWAGFNATAPPGSVHATRQDTADQMHRRGKYARPSDDPADITGESERLA